MRRFRTAIGPVELLRRTGREILEDNCLGLAAQLAFYFLLALFPALIFLVALIGALPVQGVMTEWLHALSRFAPPEVLLLVRSQLAEVARGDAVGLLTIGLAGAVWSSSAAMVAIITTLNRAYDLTDRRPWWRRRLLAVVLTAALATFMVLAQGLLLLGPWATAFVSERLGVGLGAAWTVARWGLTLALVMTALDLVYHFAPARPSRWVWLSPGAIVATLLWLAASLGFRLYVTNIGDYTATYGALGGVIVLMLWFYLSGLAILVGAEFNAEIERAAREAVTASGQGVEHDLGRATD